MSKNKPKYLKWSFTKLKLLEFCPEKFYHRYVLYDRHQSNSIDFLDGRVLQALFEHWINYQFWATQGKPWLLNSLPNFYHYHFNEPETICRLRKNDSHSKHLKTLKKMVEKTIPLFVSWLTNKAQIQSELELKVPLESEREVDVTGKLDFLVKIGDYWIIPDLKATTKSNKSLDKRQLVFYNFLVQKKYGRMADKSFFFTAKDGQKVDVEVTQEDVKELEKELKDATHKVRGTAYRTTVTDLNKCFRCPYKEDCWLENKLIPDSNEIIFKE